LAATAIEPEILLSAKGAKNTRGVSACPTADCLCRNIGTCLVMRHGFDCRGAKRPDKQRLVASKFSENSIRP
jgi:hypothetical protein